MHLKSNVGKLIIGHYSQRYYDLNPLLFEAQTVFSETYLAIEGEKFDVKRKYDSDSVDSGSSKTEFNLIDGRKVISQFKCIGLNPFIVSEFIIKKSLNQLDLPFEKITELHFYGAGCGSTEKSDIMQSYCNLLSVVKILIFTLIY